MDKTIKSICCDGCEKEMSKETPSPADYGLVLSCKDFNTRRGGLVHSVMVYPILERDHHFCGLKCLNKWIKTLEENL